MTSHTQRTIRRYATSGLSRRTLRQMAGMLLIGCVPLLLFALLSFLMITRPMLENRRSQDRQSLLQIQQGVERVLLNTDVALTMFVESDTVLQSLPLNMDNTDYKAYWKISKQLQQLQVFDALYPDACLISRQGGWLINSSGMYRLDTAEFTERYRAYLEGSSPSRWVTELDRSLGKKIYDYFFMATA